MQLLELRRDAIQPGIDAIDVCMARYAQPPQRARDRLIRPLLDVLAPPLHLVSQIGWHVEGLANVIEQRLSALVDDLAARVDQRRGTALLLREDDLGQSHLCQVVTVISIDDLDLVPGADQLRAVSYTHLRAHETRHDLVCRLLLEKK